MTHESFRCRLFHRFHSNCAIILIGFVLPGAYLDKFWMMIIIRVFFIHKTSKLIHNFYQDDGNNPNTVVQVIVKVFKSTTNLGKMLSAILV